MANRYQQYVQPQYTAQPLDAYFQAMQMKAGQIDKTYEAVKQAEDVLSQIPAFGKASIDKRNELVKGFSDDINKLGSSGIGYDDPMFINELQSKIKDFANNKDIKYITGQYQDVQNSLTELDKLGSDASNPYADSHKSDVLTRIYNLSNSPYEYGKNYDVTPVPYTDPHKHLEAIMDKVKADSYSYDELSGDYIVTRGNESIPLSKLIGKNYKELLTPAEQKSLEIEANYNYQKQAGDDPNFGANYINTNITNKITELQSDVKTINDAKGYTAAEKKIALDNVNSQINSYNEILKDIPSTDQESIDAYAKNLYHDEFWSGMEKTTGSYFTQDKTVYGLKENPGNWREKMLFGYNLEHPNNGSTAPSLLFKPNQDEVGVVSNSQTIDGLPPISPIMVFNSIFGIGNDRNAATIAINTKLDAFFNGEEVAQPNASQIANFASQMINSTDAKQQEFGNKMKAYAESKDMKGLTQVMKDAQDYMRGASNSNIINVYGAEDQKNANIRLFGNTSPSTIVGSSNQIQSSALAGMTIHDQEGKQVSNEQIFKDNLNSNVTATGDLRNQFNGYDYGSQVITFTNKDGTIKQYIVAPDLYSKEQNQYFINGISPKSTTPTGFLSMELNPVGDGKTNDSNLIAQLNQDLPANNQLVGTEYAMYVPKINAFMAPNTETQNMYNKALSIHKDAESASVMYDSSMNPLQVIFNYANGTHAVETLK